MLTGLCLAVAACCIFVVTAPVVVLPTPVLREAMRNCFRSDGTFSGYRSKYEFRAFTDLGRTMLVVLLLILSPLLLAAIAIHSLVIPAPLAIEALLTNFSDSDAWRTNPRRGPFEDVARRHEQFVMEQGGTRQDALKIQRVLWRSLPAIGIVWLAAMFVFADWICRLSRTAFRDYHHGLRTRSMILSNKRHARHLCEQPEVQARRDYLTGCHRADARP